MVGIVIISHSQSLAKSVVEYTGMMAAGAKVAAAGGTQDGSFGTSFEKICQAVDEVDSGDGVIVLMDLGSAVMTAEVVVEELGADRVAMSGCPLVEGAVVATIDALGGMSRDEILDALAKVGETPKF